MSLQKGMMFMDYKNKIIELVENNNGYIKTKEIIRNNIPKNYLKELVDERKLKKINKGLYMLVNCFEDEYFIFQSTNNDAIFSLETALYLHNYSDRVPTIYNITVPRNYGGNLRKEKNVDLLYIKPEFHNIGITEIESPLGQKIKVYDLERTICDIVKFKNKVDPEIFSKALKQYVKSKEKNLNNLILYSRQLKVEEEVRKYMEVML